MHFIYLFFSRNVCFLRFYLQRTGCKRTVSSSKDMSNAGTIFVLCNYNKEVQIHSKSNECRRRPSGATEMGLLFGSCTGSGTAGWLFFPCPSCPWSPQPNEYIFCDSVSTRVCCLKNEHYFQKSKTVRFWFVLNVLHLPQATSVTFEPQSSATSRGCSSSLNELCPSCPCRPEPNVNTAPSWEHTHTHSRRDQ